MPVWQQGTRKVWVWYYKGWQDLRSIAVRGSDQVETISLYVFSHSFRRKSILLTAQIPPTPMMTRWWDQLNGFRTTRSWSHVHLATRNPRSMGSTLPKLTRSSIYCCQRVRSSWSHITRSQQIRSWRTSSTASGTMQRLMTQMSAKCFAADTIGYRAG